MLKTPTPRLLAIVLACCGLVSCGTPAESKPTQNLLNLHFSATSNVNPDLEGRPSPIVVRVLELTSVDEFNLADYVSLTKDNGAALGDQVIESTQVVLTPGATRQVTIEPNDRTRHIGFVAGYRDIDHSVWRASLDLSASQTSSISIFLDQERISINNFKQ